MTGAFTDTHGKFSPRHRPLIPIVIGLAAGIWLDAFLRPAWWQWLVLALVVMVFSGWATRCRLAPWGNWILALLVVVPLGGGWHLMRARYRPPSHLSRVLPLQSRLCYLKGTIKREAELRSIQPPCYTEGPPDTGWQCRLEAQQISADNGRWQPACGGLKVYGKGKFPGVCVGDRVRMLAFVKTTGPPTNPGERDYRRSAARRGISGSAYVEAGEALELVHRPGWYVSPMVMVGRLRGRLKTVLRKKYRQDIDPLVRALIFGQRAALDTDTHALLSEVGSLHFLAISGLHVGMLAAFLWAVFTAAGLPLSWRSGLLILLVWLYVVFTGFQVSARRAALMVSFVSAAPLFRREGDPVNAVLGAVFVILVWNPAELFGIGFQFTLVAVWAILYIFRQLRHIVWPWGDLIDRIQQPEERTILEDVKRYGGHYLFLSTSVWLVIAPLSAHHFNHFSLLTPLVNVMLWPVVLILIIDCFLLVPVALVFPPLAGPFVGAANLLCGQIRGILHLSSRLPGFVFHTPGPPTWWILGFFAILVLWVVRKRFVRGSTCFLAGATILAISFIIPDLTARDGENLCATLLDVGHGQSIVFRAPERSVMIYDAGSVSPGRVNSLERFLWRDRHRRVSLLAVSHRDCDHCSFVPRLGEHFRIEQLVIPPLPPGVPRSVLEEKLEHACREKRSLWRGGEVRGHGLHFTALHPDERFLSMGNVSENDLSLVLLCRYAGWRMLLTGDIRTDAMDHLLREHSGELKADVLVLPHHGRWADGLVEFLEEVNPQLAVASCGDPLPGKTRQALAEADVPVWTTYRAGALQFELTPWQLTLTSFRTERKIVLRREN